MNRVKENSLKLKSAGLITDFAMAFSPEDIDRMVSNAKEATESMSGTFGMVDGESQKIIDQAEQAKKVLFNA